ncbi:hypothetical protein E2C01_038581 [Portunus trituberculatus]|uniref:Uncharacterized protein n=1 Tax=Portunus trituberculatus TaxID=210409 RepID=A0A5B7FB67_PORTR|nr:hypothetical protein [Portunus trituberculatus]
MAPTPHSTSLRKRRNGEVAKSSVTLPDHNTAPQSSLPAKLGRTTNTHSITPPSTSTHSPVLYTPDPSAPPLPPSLSLH